MAIYWLDGRSFFRAQRRSRSSERSLTGSISDPCFSNSRGRTLVSERHREIAETEPRCGFTVSHQQGYSAARGNSVVGRTIRRKAESALDT